jgi:hypothetical protein
VVLLRRLNGQLTRLDLPHNFSVVAVGRVKGDAHSYTINDCGDGGCFAFVVGVLGSCNVHFVHDYNSALNSIYAEVSAAEINVPKFPVVKPLLTVALKVAVFVSEATLANDNEVTVVTVSAL